MKLIALRINNFRSFRGTQTFTFPEKPGLYFLWGENQEEPRLEANGSGKSSLWEALVWLFYAKTSKGLKAGDIAAWDVGKGTVVELEFDVDQPAWMRYTVRRTWSPNTWTLENGFGDKVDLTKGDTNEVLARLSLEFQPFLSCILMAQGQPMFLDLKADAKAALFAEVLRLDRWLEYSQRASKRASDLDKDLRNQEAVRARLHGRLEALSDESNAVRMAEWEASHAQRRRGLERDYEQMLERLEDLRNNVALKTEARDRLREEYRIAVLDSEKHAETCSKCGQHLPNPKAKSLKLAMESFDVAEDNLKRASRDVANVDQTLDNMEARYEALCKEVNPYKQVEQDRADQIKETTRELQANTRVIDDLTGLYNLATYWVRWFKEIRLQQIGEALEELEIEVNSCVNALGLVDWELQFDVDKETKSGTIQKGFTVTVRSPGNANPVPWEAWSGGESQRLRLAGNMGLANLIRSRTGTPLGLEVWDEPTNWLSPQGVTDLLDGLAQRAVTEQRQVWIVDHRTLGYAAFDGVYGVVKDARGSRFVIGDRYNSEHEADLSHATRRSAHAVPRKRARTE